MASSDVETVSSSPFGSVLKDRYMCRESNARAAVFQKNLKELVRDPFQNSITVSADDDENSNFHSRNKQVDSWVTEEQGSRNLRYLSSINKKGNGKKNRAVNDDGDIGYDDYGPSLMSSRQSRLLDRWAAKQAREMVSSIEKQSREAELLASSASTSASASVCSQNPQNLSPELDSSAAAGNSGASSLVQMWEKRLNRPYSSGNPLVPESTSSGTSSGNSNNDSEPSRESETGTSANHDKDEARDNNQASFVDWESQSDKTGPPTRSNSDAAESEKVRIADIIKRLANDAKDLEPGTRQIESPSRERRHSPVMEQAEQREQKREIKNFSRVICSPKIRGRQAFTDLLMQLERDRHRELEALGERQAVSKFTHRGRLQAMLRLRFLHRCMAAQDQQPSLLAGSKSFNRLSERAAIRHLREKFTPCPDRRVTSQNDGTTSRNLYAEMENYAARLEDSSTANGLREDGDYLQEAACTPRKSTTSKEKSTSGASEDHRKDARPKTDFKLKGTNMETTSDSQKDTSLKSDVKQKGINMETASNHQRKASPETGVREKGLNLEPISDHQTEANPETDFRRKGLNIQTTSVHRKEASVGTDITLKALEIATSSDHHKKVSPKTDVTCKGDKVETPAEHSRAASPRSDVSQKGLNMQTTFLDPQGTAETATSQNGRGTRNEITENQETSLEKNIHDQSPQLTASLDVRNVDEQQLFCLVSQENADTTASGNDLDENELAEEEEEETYLQDQFIGTNYDWIREISRPRSYWEDRRQTWYWEMLNSNTENEEIRQLLERRRVSTFLSSDFRERMDQLMTSRVERLTQLEVYQAEEEEEMSQERVGQLLSAHLQRHIRSEASQERDQVEQLDEPNVVVEVPEPEHPEDEEEHEEDELEEEEEEELTPISPLFPEASDDFDQISPSTHMSSPSTTQTWSYQDHEVRDESDQVPSTSLPQPLPSGAYCQDSRQSSSSTDHLTIETELIYDLRGQIEQLHHEMSELRKSVQSCMSMQVELHQSNQREAHSAPGKGHNSLCGAPKERRCCICYEMQVDSLLYRCGHMCTCLKCAHELQWSSGKCPICRAPIDDVVRAFMDM